jgi:predicted transcriptional regulator
MPKPSELALQWKIRLKDDLHQRLDAAAKQNSVSRNMEVVARLERSFDKDPVIGLAADMKRLLKMHERA